MSLHSRPRNSPFTWRAAVPFDAIKKARPIDQLCDVAGDADEAPHQAQNAAKNNFCAPGPSTLATRKTFERLQSAVDARPDIECCGDQHLPTDRTKLRALHTTSEGATVGEGTAVQFVAFLIRGKFSNVGHNKGESVNCHQEDREENDIHLNLVRDKPPAAPTKTQLEALECHSVVAEISPHFRPEAWEALGRLTKTTQNATAAKKIAALDLDRPMRFTGPLFFDANHKPCVNGQPQDSSRRISAWEIHPLYAMDVCVNTSISGCPKDVANRWVPLDRWLATEEEDN